MILSGDIGGTHTRLGLFHETGEVKAIAEKKYLNCEASGLEELIDRFLEEQKIDSSKIGKICLAIAGPIQNGRCHMTNLQWTIDASKLRKNLGVSACTLINDLEAHALGLRLLRDEDVYVLQAGDKRAGNQALVFSGTGLGEAGMVWDGHRHLPFAGEGGHADFAPRNEGEIALFLHLRKKYSHVSYERVVSGQGLYEIYRFLIESEKRSISRAIESELQTRNPASVILEMSDTDKVCGDALDLFLSIYGAEAGNVALKFLSRGGLYIGGGMVSRLAHRLKNSSFLGSFCDKGRFQEVLKSIPVSLVLSDNTALLGAMLNQRSFKS